MEEQQKRAEGIGRSDSNTNLPFRPKATNDTEEISKQNSEAKNPRSPKLAKSTKNNNSKAEKLVGNQSTGAKITNESSQQPSNQDLPRSLPDFIIQRNKLFDDLKRRHDAEILEKDHPTINVVLDLGSDKDGKARPAMPVAAKAWDSTPGSFLRHVDKDITSDVVVAKVDGKHLWDLDRPLEYDCRVSYLPFASAEGRNVFWHSGAHVLGEAAECQFQCLLSHGPPVEQGFFYDMAIAEG